MNAGIEFAISHLKLSPDDADKLRAAYEKSLSDERERIAAEREAHPFVYCVVETQRKNWHLGDEFDDWDHLDRDRDDFTDTYTFRRRKDVLTNNDKELVERYGRSYFPAIHDEMTRQYEADLQKSKKST